MILPFHLNLRNLLLSLVLILVLLQSPAQAHPLGNFTLNQYAGIQISSDQIKIDYVLDRAEIPAFQEIQKLDLNHNRHVDPEEIQTYPAETCDHLSSDLKIALDQSSQRIPLSVQTSGIDFPPGVGGLSTLRLTCELVSSPLDLSDPTQVHQIHIQNQIYPQRLGWREITVTSDLIPIQSALGSASLSQRLAIYPTDLLSSPLDQREATIVLHPEATTQTSQELNPTGSANVLVGRQGDLMTELLTLRTLTPITTMGALILAFLWGGAHALTPGHGKTVVGAYLVGSKGTPQQAIWLGLTTTIAHTSSVFILGLIALVASQFLITESLYPWLSLISGGLIVGVGLMLFRRRIRDLDHHSHHHHTDHSHPDHLHPDHHHHHHGHHDHEHHHSDPDQISWLSLLGIGISGGLLPCPSALLVMLGSITLGRIGFGFALVLAFSLGLAMVLTGVGLLFIYARDRIERSQFQLPRWRGWSALSALFILAIGLGITGQAIYQLRSIN